jgi:hypothetical protein
MQRDKNHYCRIYLICPPVIFLGITFIIVPCNPGINMCITYSIDTAHFINKYIDGNYIVNIVYNHGSNCTIQYEFDEYNDAMKYYNQTFTTIQVLHVDETKKINDTTMLLCDKINDTVINYLLWSTGLIIISMTIIYLSYTIFDHIRYQTQELTINSDISSEPLYADS